MKINLAVWTAVEGYRWQPGSVYSESELAAYKDEIGPLKQDSLPLGGLFIKNGNAVFYRVQIAEHMDSHGRAAIYCVLGTLPVESVAYVDFADIFNSAEVSRPQKPFPTAMECESRPREYKSPLGRTGFSEKNYSGKGTFHELGGWCEQARGLNLNVRITGTMESPAFTVKCGYPAPFSQSNQGRSRGSQFDDLPSWGPRSRHSPEDADASRWDGEPQFVEWMRWLRKNSMLVVGAVIGILATMLIVALIAVVSDIMSSKGGASEKPDRPKREAPVKSAVAINVDETAKGVAKTAEQKVQTGEPQSKH